jgi:hypothetical protein
MQKVFTHKTTTTGLYKVYLLKNHESKLRDSKVAVCCFSWGICYDFYGVKQLKEAFKFHSSVFYQATLEDYQLSHV